jgi:hypothetical protein
MSHCRESLYELVRISQPQQIKRFHYIRLLFTSNYSIATSVTITSPSTSTAKYMHTVYVPPTLKHTRNDRTEKEKP